MRKRKKIELVEALATLCRDIGYKKVTADSFDDEEFTKKVIDTLNHTVDTDQMHDIHERFYQIICQNKKIAELLKNELFKDNFNELSKGISRYKIVTDKQAVGTIHFNNYFGLDSNLFFCHNISGKGGIEALEYKHHKIYSEGDPIYVNSKKATVCDENGNRLIQVILNKHGEFVFKHNKLSFAVEFNPDNGLIYMMSYEYRDSIKSFDELDLDKCLAAASVDLVSDDSSLSHAYVLNLKNNNKDLGIFYYVILAAMNAVSLALGKSKKSNTFLNLLLLGLVLKKIE